MSDSLITEALGETRFLLEDLDDVDDTAADTLRARVDILERASATLELRPALREDILRIARLAMEVRDDAVALRRRYRSVHQLIQSMMD